MWESVSLVSANRLRRCSLVGVDPAWKLATLFPFFEASGVVSHLLLLTPFSSEMYVQTLGGGLWGCAHVGSFHTVREQDSDVVIG